MMAQMVSPKIWALGGGPSAIMRPPVLRIFLGLVSNTNTHAARTRTGAHESIRSDVAEAWPRLLTSLPIVRVV